jgi:hypothetical protein
MGFIIAISLPLSAKAEPIELKNLITELHLQAHSDHHHHSEASSHNHHHRESARSLSSKDVRGSLTLTHNHHHKGSHENNKPHEHSFSMSTPMVLYFTPVFTFNTGQEIHSSEKVKFVAYLIEEPDKNALFRPPIL